MKVASRNLILGSFMTFFGWWLYEGSTSGQFSCSISFLPCPVAGILLIVIGIICAIVFVISGKWTGRGGGHECQGRSGRSSRARIRAGKAGVLLVTETAQHCMERTRLTPRLNKALVRIAAPLMLAVRRQYANINLTIKKGNNFVKRPLGTLVTLLVLMVMIFSGCSNNPMSQRTYDNIHNGMTLSEVDKIMGFSETKSDSPNLQISNQVMRLIIYNLRNEPSSMFMVSYAIVEKGKEIKVKFDNGKVISKECKGL